jgi:plastocyanin
MRVQPSLAIVPVLVLAIALAGCSGNSGGGASASVSVSASGSMSSAPGDKTVAVRDNYFDGGNQTVSQGTTIHYTNMGQHGHTVTIHWVGDPITVVKLNQTIQPGQSVAFTFDSPGTYHIWCRFHGTMTTGMASIVAVQ